MTSGEEPIGPDPTEPRRTTWRKRFAVAALAAYPAWLAMTAAHEAGHALHAWVSGGTVVRIEFPLIGFSQTHVSPNPRPQFVAWGGPIWGCVLPVAVLALAHVARRAVAAGRAFAGFCLACNGAYVGLGPFMTAGDGHDLLRHGAPRWALIAFGVVAVGAGLYLWHLIGAKPVWTRRASPPAKREK